MYQPRHPKDLSSSGTLSIEVATILEHKEVRTSLGPLGDKMLPVSTGVFCICPGSPSPRPVPLLHNATDGRWAGEVSIQSRGQIFNVYQDCSWWSETEMHRKAGQVEGRCLCREHAVESRPELLTNGKSTRSPCQTPPVGCFDFGCETHAAPD